MMMLQSSPARGFFSKLLVLGLFALETVAVITTGATNANGIQTRKEIRDLINDKTSWYIFLQALASVQAGDQGNLTAWYQIAGIHGLPQVTYDGVTGVSNPSNPGYCTHTSNLFTTWHRPYLALFEQALVAAAQGIAAQYPAATQAKYVAAANNLRLPYWDWAKKPGTTGNYPNAFTSKTATVITPTGTQTINNPLYSYRFHPNPGNLRYQIFNQWYNTLRSPNSQNSDAQSDDAASSSNVNSWQSQLHDRVYTLLTQYNQYNQFSNKQWITQNPPAQDSVESVHDVIHGATGGQNYGHMGVVDVAAFDPLFWLHHAMIDRLFAIWQVSFNQSWFQPQTQSQGTYWYSRNYVSQSATPLKPFKRDAAGTFYTSDDVRDWTVFQYTYPELPQGLSTSPSTLAATVNKLYGSTTTSTTKRKRSLFDSVVGELKARAAGSRPEITIAGTSSTVREYTANIRAQSNAYGQTYTIYFFLGDYPSDPSQWLKSDNLIGAQPITSPYRTAEQVAAMSPVIVGAAVPLNRALVRDHDSGALKSLDDSDIEPYLTSKLHWEVQASNGTVFDKSTVPNLIISVISNQIKPATSETKYPKRVGASKLHIGITKKKAAGLNDSSLTTYESGPPS